METKTMNAIFSENLRNRLYLKRMTQGELAKNLGVSEASVSKWCAGEAVPRPKKIDQICILLGCNIEDLTTDHTREVELAPENITDALTIIMALAKCRTSSAKRKLKNGCWKTSKKTSMLL